MKHLASTITMLLLGALHTLGAAPYGTQWQKGNSFYQNHQYDSAAYYFEQIAAVKPQNEAVYYNLGNTYYRLNKVAPAVLNYERALKINPENKEARDNLLLAQSRISNHIAYAPDIFFISWWQNLTKAGNATMWSVTSLLIFIFIIALIYIRRFHRPGRVSIPGQLTGILVFAFVCFLFLAVTAAMGAVKNAGAVVMQKDAPLMNADLKGKPLLLLPEGTTVKIINEKNAWAEVALPDGRNGWVQTALLEKI